MVKYLKEISSGLFMLVVAFSYSIYFIVQTGFGLPPVRSLFQIYSGVLTVIMVMQFMISIREIPPKATINVLMICALVVFMFILTSYFYNMDNSIHNSFFLSMGVRFIPAMLAGAVMLKDAMMLQKVEKALLPFSVFYTVIIAQVVLNAKAGVNMVDTFNSENGLNYQNLSYYSIFAFGMTLYIIFYGHFPKLVRYGIIGMALLQIVMTIMTGGRGAFLLGLVLLFYFGSKKLSVGRIILYLIIGYIGLQIVSSFFAKNDIFQMGFDRIFNFFSNRDAVENDLRWERWEMAWKSFLASPLIGHGLGSVFYEVGFYSHNIFTDMLCEGGVLFTGLFLYWLIKFLSCIRKLNKVDSRYGIIMIVFLCSFIMLCFSGYYLSESGIWLSMAYILNQPMSKAKVCRI